MSTIVTSSMAERIVDDILSSNSGILSAGVIDKSGNIIANKSSESFEKRFKGVSNLERNRYSGTLAVAALSIANEVKGIAGETKAITTTYEKCKMMLIPIPSYEILVGFVLQRRVVLDEERLASQIEGLVADNAAAANSGDGHGDAAATERDRN